ncbi:MAG: TolC family protein [Candidatus Wallbacteria bacterium]|nr:TolC family protein [Candidatus Wallbacteria bacterium]
MDRIHFISLFLPAMLALVPAYCETPAKISSILDYALSHSPEYRQQEIGHRVSQFQIDLSYYAYKPRLTISGDDSLNRSLSIAETLTDGLSLSYEKSEQLNTINSKSNTLTLSSDILSSLTDYKKRILDLQREEEMISFTKSRESFKLKVINSAFGLVQEKKNLAVQMESQDQWKNNYEYYKAKFELGSINKISLLNAEVNYLDQENSVDQSKKSLDDAIDQFKILIGYPLSDTLEINQELTAEAYDWVNIPMNPSFDVRLSDLSLDQKKLQLKSARNDLPGDLSMTSTFQSGNSRTFSGSLSYSFYLGEQKNAVSYKDADLSVEREELSNQEKKQNSESERREIVRRYETLKRSLEVSKKRLESASENQEYARIAIQKGLISSLDLQDAQQKLTSAQVELLNAIISYNKLKYEIINTFGGII